MAGEASGIDMEAEIKVVTDEVPMEIPVEDGGVGYRLHGASPDLIEIPDDGCAVPGNAACESEFVPLGSRPPFGQPSPQYMILSGRRPSKRSWRTRSGRPLFAHAGRRRCQDDGVAR
jgi:hypothetical protein